MNRQSSRSHAVLQLDVRDSRDGKVGRYIHCVSSFHDITSAEMEVTCHRTSYTKLIYTGSSSSLSDVLFLAASISCNDCYGKTVSGSVGHGVMLMLLNSPGGSTMQRGVGRGLLCVAPCVRVCL